MIFIDKSINVTYGPNLNNYLLLLLVVQNYTWVRVKNNLFLRVDLANQIAHALIFCRSVLLILIFIKTDETGKNTMKRHEKFIASVSTY